MRSRKLQKSGAVTSKNGKYRYRLTREIGPSSNAVMFLMLNPSVADDSQDDPTIRRCIGFARLWGFGWMHVTNLSPLRATDSKELRVQGLDKPRVRKRNMEMVLQTAAKSNMIVAAWGDKGIWEDRASKMLKVMKRHGHDVYCLQLTKRNQPRHPQGVKGNRRPMLFQQA